MRLIIHPLARFGFFTLTAVLLAAACQVKTDNPTNNNDSDEECQRDSDCKGDDVCSDDGECVAPKAECEEDSDCEGDDVCSEDGECVAPEAECEEDSDCEGDDVCSEDGECVAPEESDTLVIGNNGKGGRATTESGTILTFGDGSLPEGTRVTVEDIGIADLTVNGHTFDVAGGVLVTMDEPAETPAVISVPNGADVDPDSQILVVEVVELPDGTSGVNVVGTASVSEDGETIVTNNDADADTFPGEAGVDESGTYILVTTDGDTGLTVGQVTNSDGDGVGGVYVQSSGGIFVGVTDDQGYFAIPDTIGSVTIYVNDPETGAYGNSYVPVADEPQTVDIVLTTPAAIAEGLPGGCLDETPEEEAYATSGNTAVVSSLGNIAPQQGAGMALMTTGTNAEDNKTSSLALTLNVPEGASSLRFSYRFLSNEYPDYVDSEYNDLFDVIAYMGQSSTLLIEERVADAEMTEVEGSTYGGATSWKGVSVDVSDLAGSNTPLTLSFVVSDVGDTAVDTAALIDNLRFDSDTCDGVIEPVVDEDDDGYAAEEDCNDANAAVHPGATESCEDEIDNDCDGETNEGCSTTPDDQDGDGVAAPEDCDDNNAAANPNAPEVCDEADNDCDGETDEGCNEIVDEDGDTYPPETDCDDNDATRYPGAPEFCDEKDNNCNETVDENCSAQLPQSHHIDLSMAGGFVGTAMYAIYQRFDSNIPLDLNGYTLTFVPDANHTSYTVTAGALAWDSDVGSLWAGDPTDTGNDDTATNCDDCYDTLTPEFPFVFYGTTYDQVFVGENGYLTFSRGDATYTESVEYFLVNHPRISAMFDDLDTRGGTTTDGATINDDILVYSSSSKMVVTYSEVQHFNMTKSSNSFQFVLMADGTIKISFDGIQDTATGCITGIGPGSITTTTSG